MYTYIYIYTYIHIYIYIYMLVHQLHGRVRGRGHRAPPVLGHLAHKKQPPPLGLP